MICNLLFNARRRPATARWVLAALSVAGVFGQTQTIPAPNCSFGFTLTTSGASSTAYANNPTGAAGVQCAFWTVTYQSNGFSAVSLAFQGAPDSSGSPGSWNTYQSVAASGSLLAGSNPGTATTTGYGVLTGYAPWVRVTLTATGTGNVRGFVSGWYNNPALAGGGGGGGTITCSTPGCVVIGPDATGAAPTQSPVATAGLDGAGNVQPSLTCTQSALVSTSATNSVIVAGAVGKTTRICRILVTPATAVTLAFTYGSGTTCGTGTTGFGSFQSVVALDVFSAREPVIAAAGKDVCMTLSSGVLTTGTVIYAQY